MNRLSDIIEMGGNLYEEAWNNGRREALKEVQNGKYEKLEEINRALQAQIDNYETIRRTKDEQIHRYEEQLNMLHEMRQKLEDENEVLKAKVDSYDGVSREQATEVVRLKEQVKELNEALAIYRVPTPRACPFCGGPAEVHQLHKDEWYVACGNSDCPVNPETNTFDTEAEAIEAWNHSYEVPKVTCDWR